MLGARQSNSQTKTKSGLMRSLPAVLLLVPIALWATTLYFFFPGSIDYDFPETLREAQSLEFRGGQSPTAAIVIHLLSLGRFYVAPIFLLQVSAVYAALAYAIWKSGRLSTSIAILLLCGGPIAIILAPTLRLSYIANSFIALALSLGLFGNSPKSLYGAIASLLFASLFSTGFEVGYIFTVALILAVRFPRRIFAANLIAGAGFLLISSGLHALLLSTHGAGSVDRSRALYISKLSDIAGVYSLTHQVCLDGRVTLTGESPTVALDRSYRLGVIKNVVWHDPDGFVDSPTREQIRLVDECWARTIMLYPGAYVAYKSLFLQETFRNGWFAGHFTDGEMRDNPVTQFILKLNTWIVNKNYANLLIYGVIFVFASVAALFAARNSTLNVFALGATAAFGFMLPHLIFGQEAMARYTIVPMTCLCWVTALQVNRTFSDFSITHTRERITRLALILFQRS
jgi:hypothetical protein